MTKSSNDKVLTPSTASHGTRGASALTKSARRPSIADFPPKISPPQTLSPVKTNTSGCSSSTTLFQKLVPFASEHGYFS